MSDNPLPPNHPPDVLAPVIPSSSRITCEFCECSLTPTGGAFRLSDRARMLRDQEEEIRRLKDALAQAEGAGETMKRDADEARRLLAEATAAKPASRGW
jgi:hypothetical protein